MNMNVGERLKWRTDLWWGPGMWLEALGASRPVVG